MNDRDGQIKYLYEQGLPVVSICDKVGIKMHLAYQILKRLHVSLRKRDDFGAFISQHQLQKICGGDVKSLRRAVHRSEVIPVKVGTNFRYRRVDVPRVLEAMNADLVPEFREGNPIDLAWLGGFFDGEGHVALHFSKNQNARGGIQYAPQWVLVNTEKVLIKHAENILSFLGVFGRLIKINCQEKRKIVWRLIVDSIRDAAMICKALSPYLTGKKKRQSDLLLEWSLRNLSMGHHLEGKHELGEKYYRKFKELV